MHALELPEDYAVVLQQVEENGEEDFVNLSETLRFEPKRLIHIIEALRHKGLIIMGLDAHREAWIRLSSKGRHLVKYMWPESGLRPSY